MKPDFREDNSPRLTMNNRKARKNYLPFNLKEKTWTSLLEDKRRD
jgi:hypothetical protein